MFHTALVILGVALSTPAFSFESKSQFCEMSRNQAQSTRIVLPENRIDFENNGGVFNGGVCWWHSRLQRSATYLAVFRPDLPKPTKSIQVLKLLRKLKYLSQVVEIPGYENFESFTHGWQNTVQKFLNRWQIEDGVVNSSWIDGLSGSWRGNQERLQNTMMKLKEQVVDQKRISYLKLQLKGITAHAWLVFSMVEVANGLELGIIDSNFRNPIFYTYHWGDASINSNDYGKFMPYLEQTRDFGPIQAAVESYCSLVR